MPAQGRRYRAEVWDVMQLLFGKFNDHQLHCLIRLAGHIDQQRLERAVDLSADAFPITKCRFVEGVSWPYWEDGDFTAKEIVQIANAERPDESIRMNLLSNVDESVGPQLRIVVVRDADADSLCVVMNHMVCDAAGLKEYLYLLSSIYTGLADVPGYKPEYVTGSRSCRQVLRALSWRERVRVPFDRYNLSKHDSGVVFDLDGDVGSPFIVTHPLSRDRLWSIKAFAKQYGATVNDVVLAAYVRALYRMFGRAVPVPCTVDLRKYLPNRKAEGICNLSSQLICDVGQDIGEGLGGTLTKVKQVMDADKKRLGCLNAILLLEVVFATLPYPLAKRLVSSAYVNPTIHMTNLGIIDKNRLTFGDVEVTSAFMTGSIKRKPYFQVALSTFDDEVTLSTNLHGTVADEDRVRQFLCALDGELPNGGIQMAS